MSNRSEDTLPQRVKHLETLIQKQMMMIQEQQTIIEQQKCLLDNKKSLASLNCNGHVKNYNNGNIINKIVDDSLEELIDRDELENGFDSEEDDNME